MCYASTLTAQNRIPVEIMACFQDQVKVKFHSTESDFSAVQEMSRK